MNTNFIKEPLLQFGTDQHICPRRGIHLHNVFDYNSSSRKSTIILGAVGTEANCDLLHSWLELSTRIIPAKEKTSKVNLFVPFGGVNLQSGYKCEITHDDSNCRVIRESDLNDILKINNRSERVNKAVELYFEHICFLASHRNVDIIICVMPKSFATKIIPEKKVLIEDTLQPDAIEEKETDENNFRRALKAKVMSLNKPIQIILEGSLKPSSSRQDDATQAWNFFTALYYKSNGIPWRLPKNINKPPACFVGISFYRSRDRDTLQTSLAQMFDELGNGVILRGQPVEQKDDRQPHLSEADASKLLTSALNEYKFIMGNFPSRLVLHKSSKFNDEEIRGFEAAAQNFYISNLDFVTIHDSSIRLFRDAMYPPLRGSMIEFDPKHYLLLTRGSVPYFQTYPGLYIPTPLEIVLHRHDESPLSICKDILSLTKMNWNNTQFDGKYPITLACARKVGEIMKYIPEDVSPSPRYAFYM